ncbi:X-box-binding protein 1 [Melipona quadrifasciata]|uniref:X-box-binding protein 1 n=1 Tax=Melipona quadrifasciata TaxID=166423 RepID=A0A0N0U441_9HYME|nr:X-box-binding protein 1 [Melipona quadrifasciata]
MNSKNDVTSSVKHYENFYMKHSQNTPNTIGYHYVVEEYTSKRPITDLHIERSRFQPVTTKADASPVLGCFTAGQMLHPVSLSSKTPGVISATELSKSAPKLNFCASLLTDNARMDPKKLTKYEEMQDDGTSFKTDVCVRGKKRRLDHLTWEEKLQRKKLKNRVAAQTSRDRKKAKLDELEETVRTLREQNESLLREVTAEVEANSHRTNEQVSTKENTTEKCHYSERVVGKTPKDVETDGTCRSMSTHQSWHPVSSTASTSYTTSTNAPVSIKSEVEVKQEVETHDLDTIYGTYDEATNSVMIIYPGDETNVSVQECVQEVVTDGSCSNDDQTYLTPNYYTSQLSPCYTNTDSMSPSSVHSEDADNNYTHAKLDSNASDYGYESHGSPNSDIRLEKSNMDLSDLWHESFSELFPTLA